MKAPLFAIAIVSSLCALPSPQLSQEGPGHPIGDSGYRQEVRRQLAVQQELAKSRREARFGILCQELPLEEREALEFLLAYAPLSDLADYDGSFSTRSSKRR